MTYRNRTRRNLPRLFRGQCGAALVAVGVLATACHGAFGADPNAGLPGTTEFLSFEQLQARFQEVSLESLQLQARENVAAAQAELGRRCLIGAGTSTNTQRALECFRAAAASGLPLANYALGMIRENGMGVPKDLPTAIECYRRAADHGLPAAAHRLAWLTERKALPDLQPKDSLRLYELAAEQGILEAAHHLAYLYWHPPWGGTTDPEAAGYWFRFAATKGHLPACADLGWYYMSPQYFRNLRTDADLPEAERWFRLGAERSDPGCEFGLAMLELRANETSPNLQLVRKWLLKAAAREYADAFYQLGRLTELHDIPHSPSLRPDYQEAAHWYQRAATLKHRAAAARLAELALTGQIQPSGTLIEQLQRASDLGDMNARVELAIRYQKTEARPRGETDSPLALLESAAEAGNARAQLQLSDWYATGTLLTRDPIRSVHCLFAAARFGSEDAHERILQLQSGRTGGSPATDAQLELQQAFDDYAAAVDTSKPERAAALGRKHLDGTYPRSPYWAAVWLSFAGMLKDAQAAAEAERILTTLDPASRDRAISDAQSLVGISRSRLGAF